jgi:peptidoglycan/LPS O-acetylase OafA/YrhL
VALYVAGISIILLALTSTVTQIVLNTPFFQFFGRISYTLYLVHALFIFWMENDFVASLTRNNP